MSILSSSSWLRFTSALHSNCIQTIKRAENECKCHMYVSMCVCNTKRTYFYCFSSAGLLRYHSYNANMLRTCKIQNVKRKIATCDTERNLSTVVAPNGLESGGGLPQKCAFFSPPLHSFPVYILLCVCLNALYVTIFSFSLY